MKKMVKWIVMIGVTMVTVMSNAEESLIAEACRNVEHVEMENHLMMDDIMVTINNNHIVVNDLSEEDREIMVTITNNHIVVNSVDGHVQDVMVTITNNHREIWNANPEEGVLVTINNNHRSVSEKIEMAGDVFVIITNNH